MLDYSGWRSYNNLNFFKCDGKRKKIISSMFTQLRRKGHKLYN